MTQLAKGTDYSSRQHSVSTAKITVASRTCVINIEVETAKLNERYLLWRGHLEPSRIYPTGRFWWHGVLVTRVTGRVLNDGRVLSHRFGRAGDGRLRGQTHLIVQGFVQLLVGVSSALRVRVLVVRGVATIGAVHGVFATRRRQVRQSVVVNVQVIFCRAIGLSVGEKQSSFQLCSFRPEGKTS